MWSNINIPCSIFGSSLFMPKHWQGTDLLRLQEEDIDSYAMVFEHLPLITAIREIYYLILRLCKYTISVGPYFSWPRNLYTEGKNSSYHVFWLDHQDCVPGKCFNFYSLDGTLGDNLESKAKAVTFFFCVSDVLRINLHYSQTGLSLPAKKLYFILLYKKNPLATLKIIMSLKMWYVII